MERVATTADRLKQIMNEMDLRQIDISKQTGIRQGTISHYIAGRLSPKADAVEKNGKHTRRIRTVADVIRCTNDSGGVH